MGIRPRRDWETHRPGGCGALSPPGGGPNRLRDPFRPLSRGGRTLPAPLPGGASRRVGTRRTFASAWYLSAGIPTGDGSVGASAPVAFRIARAIRSALFRGEGEPSPHPSPAALRAASVPGGLSPKPARAGATRSRSAGRPRATATRRRPRFTAMASFFEAGDEVRSGPGPHPHGDPATRSGAADHHAPAARTATPRGAPARRVRSPGPARASSGTGGSRRSGRAPRPA